MTEIIYDQPQERGDRFGWLKRLINDAGAGVIQGAEMNVGITPSEQRPPSVAIPERFIGAAVLGEQSGYTEAEQRAMVDSADPAFFL